MNPRKALVRGALAGVAGTAAMTALQELVAGLQSSDGSDVDAEGESEDSSQDWEQASAPAQVGKRIIEGIFHKEADPKLISPLTHAMHWGYGTGWGAVFGLIYADRDGPALGRGLGFGVAVWLASYAQLVPMGLYEPPWRYEPGDLATELSYHLAYGAGIGVGWSLLGRR